MNFESFIKEAAVFESHGFCRATTMTALS